MVFWLQHMLSSSGKLLLTSADDRLTGQMAIHVPNRSAVFRHQLRPRSIPGAIFQTVRTRGPVTVLRTATPTKRLASAPRPSLVAVDTALLRSELSRFGSLLRRTLGRLHGRQVEWKGGMVEKVPQLVSAGACWRCELMSMLDDDVLIFRRTTRHLDHYRRSALRSVRLRNCSPRSTLKYSRS